MNDKQQLKALNALLAEKEAKWSSTIMELEQLRRGIKCGDSDALGLMRSELEKYKLIMRMSCDVFWDFYPNTMLTVFSPGFTECTGWGRLIYEDFDHLKALVHPEDLPKFTDNMMGVLYGQQPGFNYEFRLLCADGEYGWFNNRCYGIRDDDTGELIYILGLTHDFTHFRRQEAFLQEEKVKNQILLKTATDYIWECDFEKQSVHFSRELADLLGLQDVTLDREAVESMSGLRPLLDFVVSARDDEAARRNVHLQLFNCENSQSYWFDVASFPLRNVKGEFYKLIGTMHDINEKKQLEDAARRDPLTLAYNRRAAYETFERKYEHFVDGGDNCGVLFMDIDNFKLINDTYGHAAGDVVLQEMVALTHKVAAHGAETYRWGGEEFVILCTYEGEQALLDFGEHVRRSVEAHSLRWKGQPLRFTISVGMSIFDKGDTSYDNAIQRADAAVYAVKGSGKNGVQFRKP